MAMERLKHETLDLSQNPPSFRRQYKGEADSRPCHGPKAGSGHLPSSLRSLRLSALPAGASLDEEALSLGSGGFVMFWGFIRGLELLRDTRTFSSRASMAPDCSVSKRLKAWTSASQTEGNPKRNPSHDISRAEAASRNPQRFKATFFIRTLPRGSLRSAHRPGLAFGQRFAGAPAQLSSDCSTIRQPNA